MKRTNETNQGKVTKSLARGQSLVTPIGKDSSDYAGPISKEVTSKMKLGGGIHDYSKVNGRDD
jgi:hypothetical protein